MSKDEVPKKLMKDAKAVPGVPVKAGTLSKIHDFFLKWKDSPLKDRPAICRSISDTEIPFAKTIYFNKHPDIDGDDFTTSEDESGDDSSIYRDIPHGHFGVMAGITDEELTRFVIPIKFLRLPPFQVMLRKSDEAYGLIRDGPLRLPVEPNTFRYILQCSLAQYKDAPLSYSDYESSSDDETTPDSRDNFDSKSC